MEAVITVTLLQPQIPGGRRVIPRPAGESAVTHLRELLEQGDVWVTRARWRRWLEEGRSEDTVAISSMVPDERLAARVWLRQQRHGLHSALGGEGLRAPDEWLCSQPLYDALDR